jgi:hypothetical protein
MTAENLLHQLHAQGLCFSIESDGGLRVGPKAALTPELRALIQTHKPALIEVLNRAQDAAEFYEERAAILEYDAGFTRKEAEAEAARLTVVKFRLHNGEGGGSVIAHDATFAEILADLQSKYGARLAEVCLHNAKPTDKRETRGPRLETPPF